MNIITHLVLDMTTGAVLDEERQIWNGPMALCKGGGSSTTTVTNSSTPDYAYNARLAAVAERQQNLADTYFNWWQQKQAPVEEATLKSQAELLPLQTEVSKAGLEGLKSVQGSFFKAVQPKSSLLAAGQAATDVSRAMSKASGTMARDMSRLGINPASGATAAGMRDLALQSAAMQAGGDISALDASQITSPRDMMALGAFQEQYLKTREGQSKIYEAHNKLAEQQYNMLAGTLDYLERIQDDPMQWGAGVEMASRRLNLPYNVRFDRERGDFEVLYQGEDGREATTGQRMSRDEMAALAGEWRNGRTFSNAYAQHVTALIESNIAAKKDPSTWLRCTDARGGEATLIPQRQPTAGGGIETGYLVMRPGRGTEFVPVEQLGERGISMRSVEQALQEQNTRLQIERNKVGLQSDRMNLAMLGRKWEQARSGTALTKEDDDFIKGLCLGKDEVTGQPVYNSAKASGLALLMGKGVNRYEAAHAYDQAVQQTVAALQAEARQSGAPLTPGDMQARAEQLVLSEIVERRNAGGGAGSGDGQADPMTRTAAGSVPSGMPGPAAPVQSVPKPVVAGRPSTLRDVAAWGAAHPRADVPALNNALPQGWAQELYAAYRQSVGEEPAPDMPPDVAVARIRDAEATAEGELTSIKNAGVNQALQEVLGSDVRVRLPGDVARELVVQVRAPHPRREVEDVTREWRAHASLGGGTKLYDAFVSMFGKRPESIGVNPPQAMRYVQAAMQR